MKVSIQAKSSEGRFLNQTARNLNCRKQASDEARLKTLSLCTHCAHLPLRSCSNIARYGRAVKL